MVYVINDILLLIISIVMVTSKPCDILENMSCECHSSLNNLTEQLACTNHHTPLNGSIKITNFTLHNPRTFDSFHLTFHARDFNISAMFINQLSYLFPRSSTAGRRQVTLKIILTFQDYLQLRFEDYSFYQLFGEKPEYTTSLSLELTSSGHISFSPMALNQLIVDQLSLHSSSLEPYSFEEIFNQTKIGSLAIEGCTPRVNNTLRRYFNGKIRSGKFTKMVEMVSSEEFPEYPVSSMIIEAHEPRKMNASSFISYHHLHGVHLIRPKFFFDNRSFDGFQYLPNLETIELDAETIKDNTFKPVLRTRFFTLGPNVRYLSEHSFDHLDYLTRFDLSKVILDQLYPSSKCTLARNLQRQLKANPSMIILPPQAEFCDCVYDFILNLVDKKPEQSYTELCENTQQERCQLNECDVVRKFRFPSKDPTSNQEVIPSIDVSISDNPITFNSNPNRFPSHIPRHPPVYHGSNSNDESSGSSYAETQGLHASSFKANNPIDPNEISTDDDDVNIHSQPAIHKSQLLTDNDEHQQLIIRNKRLKSIALSLLGITVISVLVVGTIIWYFHHRASATSAKSGFRRVPPVSSNV